MTEASSMMTSMIEVVARAIKRDHHRHCCTGAALDDISSRLTDAAMSAAIAALTAMRNCTPEMIAAALPTVGNPTMEQTAIGSKAIELLPRTSRDALGIRIAAEMVRDWQAAIDAALAGEVGDG